MEVAPFVDEIIVIDDGSQDQTAEEARRAGAIVIRQHPNQGYLAAIRRGFIEAHHDIVVTIDADGEFPAQAIPRLLQPILEGRAEMVQGHRNIVPRLSERFITWLAARKSFVGDSGTGLRAIKTQLARRLRLPGACICGIFALEVTSLGGRILEVPIDLQIADKPRRIAWYHVRQLFYLIPWLFRPIISNKKGEVR